MHWLHVLLAYGYEVLGGILIFVSSAVTETELPEAKRRKHWIVFGGIAILYIAFGIGIRYDEVKQSGDDRAELRTLRRNTEDLMSTFNTILPLFTSLSADIAGIKRDVTIVEKGDPRAIADLTLRAKIAQEQADSAAKQMLLTVVPRFINQLEDRNRAWKTAQENLENFHWEEHEHAGWDHKSAAELQAIDKKWATRKDALDGDIRTQMRDSLTNANYFREQMLRIVPQTEDDQKAVLLFKQLTMKTDFQPWDVDRAIEYLQQLSQRLKKRGA